MKIKHEGQYKYETKNRTKVDLVDNKLQQILNKLNFSIAVRPPNAHCELKICQDNHRKM